MRLDGSVVCWGGDDYGEAPPFLSHYVEYGQAPPFPSPANVRVVQEGSTLRVDWDPVRGATHYKVYYALYRYDWNRPWVPVCRGGLDEGPDQCNELDGNVVGTTYTHDAIPPIPLEYARSVKAKVIDRTSDTLTLSWPYDMRLYYWITACGNEGCSETSDYVARLHPQHYLIHRQPEGGTTQEIRRSDLGDPPQYVDKGLQPSTVYYYWVQACVDYGCSDASDKTAGLTESDGPVDVPSSPTLQGEKHVQSWASDSATVTWESMAGATYYELLYGSTPSSTFKLAFEISAPIEAQTYRTPNNSGFLGGYSVTSWKVKACNKAGCSPFSNIVTIY